MTKQLALPNGTRARTRSVVRVNRGAGWKWKGKFIRALRKTPSVKHACASAGVCRQTAYDHRKTDSVFAEQWKDAIAHSVDELETRAFKLALEGEDSVAASLITWLLRCHKPETYDPVQKSEVAVGGIVFLPQKQVDGKE